MKYLSYLNFCKVALKHYPLCKVLYIFKHIHYFSLCLLFLGKAFVPKSGSGQIPIEDQITLEPELEEALRNATDAEMCDIAGGSILSSTCFCSNNT